MAFIKINDDVMINLEEIAYIRCELSDLIIGLKNKEKEFCIHFNYLNKRDEALAKIEYAISRYGFVIT